MSNARRPAFRPFVPRTSMTPEDFIEHLEITARRLDAHDDSGDYIAVDTRRAAVMETALRALAEPIYAGTAGRHTLAQVAADVREHYLNR